MNWLKSIVCKWVRDDWNRAGANIAQHPEVVCSSDEDVDLEGGFHFSVMPARGGTIVQLRGYNRKHDRRERSTHVIPEGEDISTAIAYIVNMELLQGHPNDR